jgi:hypothetical protein
MGDIAGLAASMTELGLLQPVVVRHNTGLPVQHFFVPLSVKRRVRMSITENDAADDMVWGAAAIGKVIRKTERQAFYLLEAGLLPARKIGRQWSASRSRLLRAVTGDVSRAG